MRTPHPPIPLADYQRIFRVLKSVFDGAADNTASNTLRASIFFSIAGASLIESFYKKRCQPVAGPAYYKVDDADETVLSFADHDEIHGDAGDEHGFHCWIFCEGHIIDFMAPLFREALQARGLPGQCSRKMFQKPLSAMADSPYLLKKPGDSYLIPDLDLTKQCIQDFHARPDARDLLSVCAQWYQKPPKRIPNRVRMSRGDAEIDLQLSGLTLTGAW